MLQYSIYYYCIIILVFSSLRKLVWCCGVLVLIIQTKNIEYVFERFIYCSQYEIVTFLISMLSC